MCAFLSAVLLLCLLFGRKTATTKALHSPRSPDSRNGLTAKDVRRLDFSSSFDQRE